MSFLAAAQLATIQVIGPAAAAFIVAGIAFFGYAVLTDREATTRRVDSLRPRLRESAGAEPQAPRRARPVFRAASAGGKLGIMTLEVSRRLHIEPDRAARLLLAVRIGLGVVLGGTLLVLGHLHGSNTPGPLILLAAVGLALGWFVPAMIVQALASQRMKAIGDGLPEAIELLVIAVEAGLALDDAIDRVVVELRHTQPPVGEELALTSADLKILPSREAALAKFAERVDLTSVKTFVNTLSQTMRYGTPLAQALRIVATELRNDALMKLEENANKMPVMLTIPMVLFILPSLFMIIAGPAVLQMIRTLFH